MTRVAETKCKSITVSAGRAWASSTSRSLRGPAASPRARDLEASFALRIWQQSRQQGEYAISLSLSLSLSIQLERIRAVTLCFSLRRRLNRDQRAEETDFEILESLSRVLWPSTKRHISLTLSLGRRWPSTTARARARRRRTRSGVATAGAVAPPNDRPRFAFRS